jgi:hypothetical protein
MNGAPARGRQRAAAMPPEREGLPDWRAWCVRAAWSGVDSCTATVRPLRSPRLSAKHRRTPMCPHSWAIGP